MVTRALYSAHLFWFWNSRVRQSHQNQKLLHSHYLGSHFTRLWTRNVHKSHLVHFFFRSPPQFFEEVVLVDDESELPHLHEQLERELEKPYYKGRVTLVRNKEREGLIRSRNNGALAARGEVSPILFTPLSTILLFFYCSVVRGSYQIVSTTAL